MTKRERLDPDVFLKEPTRITRVAKGSGREDKDIVDLLQRFAFMKQMMGDIGQQAGLLSKIPGLKQLANARRLQDAVRTTGLETNPMMSTLADQLLELLLKRADLGGEIHLLRGRHFTKVGDFLFQIGNRAFEFVVGVHKRLILANTR